MRTRLILIISGDKENVEEATSKIHTVFITERIGGSWDKEVLQP